MFSLNEVKIPPVNNEIYNYPSSECQRITLRQPNSSVIALDTFDSLNASSPSYIPNSANFSSGRLVLGGIKRFAALDLHILWHGLNVNPTNSLVRFSYNDTSFEAVVEEGSYQTSTELMNALCAAMNVAVGASDFFWSEVSTKPYFGALSAPFPFYFVDCPAVSFGKHLWNLKALTPPSTSQQIGQIGMIYTRWIDVVSVEITQYVKIPNMTTTSPNYPAPGNLVARFHIDFANNKAGYYKLSRRTNSFQNFEVSNDLSSMDIQFKDEWGNLLYLKDNNDMVLDLYTEC